MHVRLLPPALAPAALSLLVAVGAALVAGLHHVDPALAFPLSEPFAAATALAAAVLAAPLPWGPVGRRVGALVVAGLALRAGLPGAHGATFPAIEMGRARAAIVEDATLWGLLAVLGLATAAPVAHGVGRLAARTLAVAAVVLLGVVLLVPTKFGVQVLAAPEPGMTTVPVLASGGPVARRWTRAYVTGSAVALLPAIVRDEWAFMEIAGGIHQEASAGEAGPVGTAQEAIRMALWRVLEASAALAHVARVLALPAGITLVAPLLANRSLSDRPRGIAVAVLRGAVWIVPIANLGALGIAAAAWLPDDRGRWLAAFASNIGMLLVVGLVEATTRRPEAS